MQEPRPVLEVEAAPHLGGQPVVRRAEELAPELRGQAPVPALLRVRLLVPGLELREHDRLAVQVRRGLDLRDGARFLHTAPHHDDIMLGYLPYIKNRLTPRASVPPDAPGPAADPPGREEGTGDGRQHVFCYCTSGFNSVTNKLMAEILRGCRDGLSVGGALRADAEAGRFSPEATRLGGRDADVEPVSYTHLTLPTKRIV